MARVQVPIVSVDPSTTLFTGVDEGSQVTGDTVNGHYITPNDGSVTLECQNTDSSSHTVTIIPQRLTLGMSLQNLVITIPANKTYLIGPFNTGVFNVANTTELDFNVSSALVKFRAYEVVAAA